MMMTKKRPHLSSLIPPPPPPKRASFYSPSPSPSPSPSTISSSSNHAIAIEQETATSWEWKRIRAQSRDHRVQLLTSGYKAASMDQLSSALPNDCSTACSVLSLTIAFWLLLANSHTTAYLHHRPPSSDLDSVVLMPSPPTLDFLLRKGSHFWSQFLSLDSVRDGLQELDTVLRLGCPLFNFTRCVPKAKAAKHVERWGATISAACDGSYTAFFRPTFDHTPSTSSLWTDQAASDIEAMAEACSLDSVWPSIVSTDCNVDKTYIVGWNAHYFVLHVPAASSSSSIFLIDTLGTRLSPTCQRAYVLKFNARTTLTFSSTSTSTSTSTSQDEVEAEAEEEGEGGDATSYQCAGDACKAYLTHFLACHTVDQSCKDFRKGLITQECLFQKLQIDFRQILLT